MRRMIATVEAFGRSFLLIDEIEKGFAGVGGGGSHDSGTTQRTLSKFLTWLSDRDEFGAFVIATSNAMTLPPEYVRSGRFAAIFYLGLPGRHTKEQIWEVHKQRFGIDEEGHPDDTDWSGAEIFQCCETAHLMRVGLAEAATYVTRVSRVAKDKLADLRTFAEDAGLIPADYEEDDDADAISVV